MPRLSSLPSHFISQTRLPLYYLWPRIRFPGVRSHKRGSANSDTGRGRGPYLPRTQMFILTKRDRVLAQHRDSYSLLADTDPQGPHSHAHAFSICRFLHPLAPKHLGHDSNVLALSLLLDYFCCYFVLYIRSLPLPSPSDFTSEWSIFSPFDFLFLSLPLLISPIRSPDLFISFLVALFPFIFFIFQSFFTGT